ncbi:hypothetical protein RHIZ404_210515 [Rhizobium sp. EC-SD404]|nr:hypothetical protein RHIZ404_210515 [Rhizobium sp. EC-SD404]
MTRPRHSLLLELRVHRGPPRAPSNCPRFVAAQGQIMPAKWLANLSAHDCDQSATLEKSESSGTT